METMDLPKELLGQLLSKTDLTETELEHVFGNYHWGMIWALQQLNLNEEPKRIGVYFSGFPPAEEQELAQRAMESGYSVAKSVTKEPTFLCCNGHIDSSVIAEVQGQGISLVDKGGFLRLLEFPELTKVLKWSMTK